MQSISTPAAHTCTSTADRAWDQAHAYAVAAGIDQAQAFADDYAFLIDDLVHETRYPDVPLPTPAEHVWP
ncbi:hypothetical protein E4U02_07645 [Microbacterium paludicola]|uniref:Uncharacterized protein n=1 Tax=Microbacterium paludicola TaxID=300019 RepID=A0A4Y9FUS8_9MICO|nr:hypothetical protein [Microbacterium paludicola]MBF0816281.1 hypothetical protein [Microbacterium paludicola]TFU33080.1 hypothetical protein E4U02_07645 [Microbacterium paludicola]